MAGVIPEPRLVYRVRHKLSAWESDFYHFRDNAPEWLEFRREWDALDIDERERLWREAACDRLDQIKVEIAELEEEIDDDWNNSGAEIALMEDTVTDLELERDELLEKFPEVRHWKEPTK